MLISRNIITVFAIALLWISGLNDSYAEQENFEFSGFARLVGGYLDQEDEEYNYYSDSIDFQNESLLGLRADYSFSKSFSVVGQAILREEVQRKSEIQWLYANYRPTADFSLRAGRQRIPMFQYSEVIDVGFAYPWVTLPTEIYNPFIFTEYDGVLANYLFSTSMISGSVDAYYGTYDGDIALGDREVGAKVDDLMGLVGTILFDQYSARASIHRGHVEAINEEQKAFASMLSSLNFINTAKLLQINDEIVHSQVSVGWENLDYFTRFEYTGTTSDAYFVPDINSFYLTLGFNFFPYTTHLTFAKSDTDYGEVEQEIPLNISPDLDFLATQVNFALQSVALSNSQTITLGLRYDWSASIALKADISRLKGQGSGSSGLTNDTMSSIQSDATLIKLAVEWVF